MFISNEEKRYLFDQIKALAKEQNNLASEVTFLKAKIKVLEAKPTVAKKPKTEAQKAKQAEYMRKYMAKKKAEKLALEKK